MPAGFVGAVIATSIVAIELVGAPTDAQQVAAPVEAIAVTPNGGDPIAEATVRPRVSDDGDVVVFDALPDGAVPSDPGGELDDVVAGSRAVVRVRSTDSTEPVPDEGGSRPSVSGDGCVVTWSRVVGAADDPAVELRLLDRCADDGPVTGLTVPGDAPLPPAALSVDGSVVVVPIGSELVRLERPPGGIHAEAGRIVPVSDGAAVVGDGVDVSDDGSIVVFEAGPGTTPFAPDTPAVVRLRAGVQQVVARDALRPSISGDGALVAFESLDRSPGGAPDGIVGVVLASWSDPAAGPTLLPIAAAGTFPSLDPSGRHLVHRTPDGMLLLTWVGTGGIPFGDSVATDLSEPIVGDAPVLPVSGPVVSRGGRTVVFDTADGAGLTTDPRFAGGIGVWARTIPVRGGGDLLDLGRGDVGDRLVGDAVIVNDGPASLAVAAGGVTVDAPFVVEATTCSELVTPGSSCTVTVAVTIEQLGGVVGEVVVAGTGPVPATLAAAVTAFGEVSTTIVPSTPSPTIRPRPTPRPTPRPRPTTTAVVPLAFSPASFEFAPTIVTDGRRRAAIELRNPGTAATTVDVVEVVDDTTGAYSIASSTCGGVLAAGAGCTIEVEFAPTVEGPSSATLVATEDDGRSTSIAVSGIGAPPPTITVIPGVAGPGQVVTVRGAGFPAGAVVELRWGDDLVTVEIVVDEVGTFDEPLVVLPNTPTGPVPLVVVGQVDLFGDVTGEMIVGRSGSRSNPALGGGFGPHVGR